MADFLSNKIDIESLRPGDHIYAYRLLHTYSHHGVYIGGDRVIHYNRTQDKNKQKRPNPCRDCGFDRNNPRGVVKSCVDCFVQPHFCTGHYLRRFRYGVSWVRFLASRSGTCTTGGADSPEVVIDRANDYLNRADGFGDYSLFDNNCEAFALFCKTGKRMSNQASAAITVFMARVTLLYKDVKVHHGQGKHDGLKQMIDSWVANNKFSLKGLIGHLQQNPEPGQEEEGEVNIEAE